jgi:DNA repair protein RadC
MRPANTVSPGVYCSLWAVKTPEVWRATCTQEPCGRFGQAVPSETTPEDFRSLPRTDHANVTNRRGGCTIAHAADDIMKDEPSPTYRPTIRDLPAEERPRERLARYGGASLSTSELLAILLRTGGRGENVLQMAQRLLIDCGGLAGLGRASFAELAAMKGIGPAKAAQVQAGLEIGRRLLVASPNERPQINSPSDAAALLMGEMACLEQEHLRLLLLDTKNRVLAAPTIYKGNVNTTVVRIAELFREAIRHNSTGLIMAHNHPSGDPTPSPEDVQMTRQIVEAGRLLGVEVLDHLIIGDNRFVSLKERGLGFA